MLTLGVDGCPAGWFAVYAHYTDGCEDGAPVSLSWAVHGTLSALLAEAETAGAALTLIDIPIGLTEGPPRACDREARRRLGARRSSVFSAPMRAMLAMPDREAASDYGRAVRQGGGVSAQAWNIVPKIAEADEAITPERQTKVREGHPEVAFARLGGAPMAYAKKKREGRAERIAVLERYGLDPLPLLAAVAALRPRPAVPDDVLDACALALSARDAVLGDAWVLGGDRDARGLRQEIVG